MGPLYYLPGQRRSLKLADLHQLGLGYALEDRALGVDVANGPSGQAGAVFADPTRIPDHKIGYYVAEQTWRKVPRIQTSAGPVWVGIYRQHPPQPKDLERLEMLPGYKVQLADGQKYVLPIARGVADGDDLQFDCRLPHAITIDDEGEWVSSGLLPRYARLWEIATAYWDCKFGAEATEDGKVSFSFAGANDAALTALAANYRVGKAEVALLGLFSQASIVGILDTLIDWHTVEEWCKKKLTSTPDPGGGSRIAAGTPGAPAAIDRPAPTSGQSVADSANDHP